MIIRKLFGFTFVGKHLLPKQYQTGQLDIVMKLIITNNSICNIINF